MWFAHFKSNQPERHLLIFTQIYGLHLTPVAIVQGGGPAGYGAGFSTSFLSVQAVLTLHKPVDKDWSVHYKDVWLEDDLTIVFQCDQSDGEITRYSRTWAGNTTKGDLNIGIGYDIEIKNDRPAGKPHTIYIDLNIIFSMKGEISSTSGWSAGVKGEVGKEKVASLGADVTYSESITLTRTTGFNTHYSPGGEWFQCQKK
ncbi:MAG: hypothetical protein HYR76_11725 [Ignavibacteria bacterium]|nr:hypothetical protein [Ignavibacteria bacterium]